MVICLHKETLNLTETHSVFVRVCAGIDVVEGEAIWEFQTIDPLTGTLQEQNASMYNMLNFINYIIRGSARRSFYWILAP